MSDQMDDPFEEGEDEFSEPNEYDEETAMAEGEAITKARADAGAVAPAPEGTEGLDRPDLEERAERARSGDGAQAVGAGEVGVFSTMRQTRTKARGEETAVPSRELEALLDRVNALEGNAPVRKIPAPDADKPFRYYLAQHYGGTFKVHAFRNLGTLQGFAQALPGEKRAFSYISMPDSSDTKVTLQEINGLGEPVAR